MNISKMKIFMINNRENLHFTYIK